MFWKKKKGFTLIELLATIVIVSLVFIVGFTLIRNIFVSSDEMDKTTEKMILNAAEEYAIEFRNSENWEEEVDGEKATFCITLESLINYGYFGSDQDLVDNYKDKYLIEMIVDNGVYDYKLVEKGISNCKYFKEETEIVDSGSGIVEIVENDVDIGNFEYKVVRVDEKNYKASIKLGIDFKVEEIVSVIPTYVVLIVDRSGSMSGTKFTQAQNASVTFSREILNKVPEARIALILYETNASLVRTFDNSDLSGINFGRASGGTNTHKAIDLAIEKINDSVKEEKVNVFSVLLFDGIPNNVSSLITSATNLKSIDSKLIVVGYDMDRVDDKLKTIATYDSEFCIDSDKEGYCYYDSDTSDISTLFTNISSTITDKVISTSAKRAKVIMSASILNDQNVFDIYKDGVKIEKIEETINIEGTSSVMLQINEDYELIINDNVFQGCTSEKCEVDIGALFNIQIVLQYDDGTEDKVISISEDNLPNFKITITESGKLN